ncbi:MAG: phosphonopyruvate hydrolase [Acetobacteraceae bacterium]|nr:phosphonopyruvate hydrolase [Acetobacteraceae bacterium]
MLRPPEGREQALGKGEAIRRGVAERGLIAAMSAHNPLSALLAEEAGFDAIWASGFELSAAYGVPDNSLLSYDRHLEMTRAMAERVAIPVIADLDTGHGNAINVQHVVAAYERAGVGAVVIEDKRFPKDTSLLEGGRQELVSIAEFQGKIEAACAARRDPALVVVARTEALIAGLGQQEALTRARAYVAAGADMILVHSKRKTPDEVLEFAAGWDGAVPLVLVPTAYPTLDEAAMRATGRIGVVIYGNHAIRAAVTAMRRVFRRIREDGGIRGADAEIVGVEEIFRLQDVPGLKAREARFLR